MNYRFQVNTEKTWSNICDVYSVYDNKDNFIIDIIAGFAKEINKYYICIAGWYHGTDYPIEGKICLLYTSPSPRD